MTEWSRKLQSQHLSVQTQHISNHLTLPQYVINLIKLLSKII